MTDYLIIIFLPISALFLGFLVFIAIRYKGFVEEDHLREPKLTSPAFKLIKNVVVKSFLSLEVMLVLLSIYILSFTVAYTSTYAYTSHVVNVIHRYNMLMVKRGFVPLDVVSGFTEKYIVLYQVFKGIEIGNETHYIIMIECHMDRDIVNKKGDELLRILVNYCMYLDNGYIITDVSSTINAEDIASLFVDANMMKVDLGEIINVELVPGLYVVHSIGTIGGLSLRIEHKDKLLLTPLSIKMLNSICGRECDIQTIILDYDPNTHFKDYLALENLLSIFDYIIVNENGEAIIMSYNLIPTPRTIVGITLSFVISMILIYAVGGGFIERIISMGRDLFVLGVTRELFASAVVLGIIITVFLSSLPLVALCSAGYVSSMAIINFAISAIGFVILTSYKLRTSIGKTPHLGFIASYNYITDVYTTPDDLISCLKEMLREEDFFILNEVEKVEEEKHHVVRLELIYKKALSTIASVEVFIDRIDHGAKYTVITDMWSLEDLSSETISTIQRMSLSKIVGGIISCLEG